MGKKKKKKENKKGKLGEKRKRKWENRKKRRKNLNHQNHQKLLSTSMDHPVLPSQLLMAHPEMNFRVHRMPKVHCSHPRLVPIDDFDEKHNFSAKSDFRINFLRKFLNKPTFFSGHQRVNPFWPPKPRQVLLESCHKFGVAMG